MVGHGHGWTREGDLEGEERGCVTDEGEKGKRKRSCNLERRRLISEGVSLPDSWVILLGFPSLILGHPEPPPPTNLTLNHDYLEIRVGL